MARFGIDAMRHEVAMSLPSPHPTDVVLKYGANHWQLFQRDATGHATLRVGGAWATETPHQTARVMVRVLREDNGEAAASDLDFVPVETLPDHTWHGEIRVPTGGPYTLVTSLRLDGGPVEWACRGDMVFHLCVGDAWLIIGQSNAAGYGKSPVVDPPELGIHMFHASGEWRLAAHPLADSTGTRYPANRERANASHSPWLHFAKIMKRETGVPVGLVPAALGGSGISAWCPSVDGKLFHNMRGFLEGAQLTGIAGALWYQGESDTGDGAHPLYRQRFTELVTELRGLVKDPSLPILTVQLNRWNKADAGDPCHPGWDAIREVQRQLAHEIPHVHIISALDLGLSDGIHNNSNGNLIIAERMATVALANTFGRRVKWRHPEPRSVKRTGDGHIEITFDHVDQRLCMEPIGVIPFRVLDESGEVPITGWSQAAPDAIALTLARPPMGKATVTGAPGSNPPPWVPFDVAGYRPMLGFTVAV